MADVVVIGARCARDVLTFGALFAETLLTARVPVFLVKNGPLQFDRAAIAWDGSNQAGRAVKAALPIFIVLRSWNWAFSTLGLVFVTSLFIKFNWYDKLPSAEEA